ncbi:UDP-N-acetylglucosamine--N-acetylmuramyl-(pentapeptide) pyrophosphoryl-undecaprenol N-acetylglucosamine transferase [Streptomonospora wellingtoniae]|uniref:UDP-N-acetylglucosamine--N-acetylmuramyl-(pentapeptide) pyrophosphoryl-undecaprenol N-acetylglucosamine transferase n=1 Tax=Streptomonospora wellingtoniae TaxID=3075544 RepID=A0ABU2KT57_9ACTN|nr:UDP-N-acetylglucosamine--N-acetylmuramyl-(pentapeptide) pyrophosphoryl-undecaprenol N-acetylglucosamine transferase [Streptomonospora sp. DSM 45055]MDT0302474.1 UDP-N-acetylglucosamine--N-acetylmuramyl-(pentapeptide) pyrophosphoryl-undecaprenol N-acetylglucosamine transferase [Streptomonospora sp. DSM 45055]
MRLIVTGGGTGGHTYPALTAVNALRARLEGEGRGLEVLWVGAEDSLEKRVATSNGIPFQAVATGKVRRSRNPLKLVSPENIRDMGSALRGVLQSRRVVAGFRPDVVLATGGYVAVPVGLAARLARRPLVVHEQTVLLGLANRVLARAGARMAVTSESTLKLLPDSAREGAVVTGNPVRPAVLEGQADKGAEGLGFEGCDPDLPTVYVTGGAQGSAQINTTVRDLLPWLLERANVVHQCGEANVDDLREATRDLATELAARHHVTAFVGPELPDVLAMADVVISRSGAGTIAELTALGKAAVFVPLASSAGDEQRHNARHLQEAGAALALLDEVSAERLREKLEPLLTDAQWRAVVADAAREHGRPDAAERLVDVVISAEAT